MDMKAILFDVDDTLYDLAVPFYDAYRELFPGVEGIPLDELFIASRKYSEETFHQSLSGELSMEEMYRCRIQRTFADFQMQISDEAAMEFQASYARHQAEISLSGTMQKILSLCAEKWTPGIITNGPSAHQWDKIRTLKLERYIPKEYIFVSGDLGTSKPEKEIFLHAVSRMGLSPEEACFVGDSFQNDVAGARNAGLNPIWLNRRGHKYPSEAAPVKTVRTEEELYALLAQMS